MTLLVYYTLMVIFLTLLLCDCFCFWAASHIDKSRMTWATVLLPMSGFWMLFKSIRKLMEAA